MKKGIDISYHNGAVDLETAKRNGIDFVIIRLGYGDDTASQDDKQFLNNVNKAKAAGLVWGLYLYSYADNMDHLESEVRHTIRCVKAVGRPPLGIWWDSEDFKTISRNLKNFFAYYKYHVEDETGVPVGLYTYKAFYNQNFKGIEEKEFPLWFAHYNSSLPENYYADFCDIWQYGSDARVNGVSGNVDINRMHRRSITAVLQVWKGLYGVKDERKKLLSAAGYNYNEVQKLVNIYGSVADDVIADKYGTGDERIKKLKNAGYVPYIVQQIVNIKVG